MDALDFEILCLIQNGARVAHASVGERLGLTAQAVHARIKRLEPDGTIRGYLTSISPAAVKQTLLAFGRITNNSTGKDKGCTPGVCLSGTEYRTFINKARKEKKKMTKRIKAVPEGYHTITPHLTVKGASVPFVLLFLYKDFFSFQ